MGYEQAADEVQDAYLARDYGTAAAAVPLDLIDQTSLLGPQQRITERLAAYAEAGVTTLTVAMLAPSLEARLATLRTMADALDASGLGD
jgi:hypothetical protein